jgi:hypothetical protein
LRSFDSLSSTLTMRSNTCGGGPSIDSKVTVAPLPACANGTLPAPMPAQPPSPQDIASSAVAMTLRLVRNKVTDVSLIAPSDIVKTR